MCWVRLNQPFLQSVDVHDKNKQKTANSVELGFGIDNKITSIKDVKKVNDSTRNSSKFKQERIFFLVNICLDRHNILLKSVHDKCAVFFGANWAIFGFIFYCYQSDPYFP